MKAIATVYRFDPAKDAVPYYQDFEYEFEEGENILDALLQIRGQDPSFSFSYGCRDRHCGLCGVMMNGKAVMACKKNAEPNMKIEPLRGMRVIKDLVIDRNEMNVRKESMQLYLQRREPAAAIPEQMEPESYQAFKIASRCVECFCCTAACPIWQKQRHTFAGPTALVLEARHVFDIRDDASRELILQNLGIDACISCGACSKVCVHKIDPCGLIRRMKEL